MKLKYFILIFILLTVLYGLTDTPVPLQVWRTNGVVASPTNFWYSNVIAGPNIELTPTRSNITIGVTGVVTAASSSLTNALLHAGPTNGSVGALVLTAGNGVTLTTSGTNRIAAIDTNIVAELTDLLWTNIPTTSDLVGDILTPIFQAGAFQLMTNRLGFFGEQTTVLSIGYPPPDVAQQGTNVAILFLIGDYAGHGAVFTNDCYVIFGFGEQVYQNLIADNSSQLTMIGEVAMGGFSTVNNVRNVTGVGSHAFYGTHMKDSQYLSALGEKNLEDASLTNCTRAFFGGTFLGQAAAFHTSSGIFGFGNQGLEASVLTNCNNITAIGNQPLLRARLTNCYDIIAIGNFAGTNLVLTAKTNILIFGNILDAIPASREFWFGNTNNISRFPGNVVIRSATAPTVGQILTATDTSGTVGWSNAPAGGSGIASIFTNNVLAGGPGLTELEFTNTSSVTWTATTNAGRVTMSATSAAGAQTPWASDINAAAFSLTNFNELALTNGMRVQQPAANVLTITNGQLQIWSGASNRVALLVTNAETLGTHTALAEFTAPKMSNGSVLKITGTWQNDNIHFPAALLVDMTQVASGSLTPLAEFRVGGSPFHSFKRSGVYDMAGNATIANSSGALTLTHANGDDVRVKSAGATPALGFYNSATAFQGNISPTAQGTLTLKTNLVTHGALINTPGTVSLTADNQSISVTNRSYIRVSSDDGTAGNRTFVISSGIQDGQMLDLEWTGTNAGELVDDSSVTGGGNVRLSATWTPTQYDVIALRWNGTDWIERFRSTN